MALNSFLPPRDHLIWYLAALAAALTYLSQQPPPWDWSYAQWTATGGVVCLYLVGKLQNSPLTSIENRNGGPK